MSLETAVIVGNAESECVKLGRAAMDGCLRGVDDEEDMSENREALEVEGLTEYWLLGMVRRGGNKGERVMDKVPWWW